MVGAVPAAVVPKSEVCSAAKFTLSRVTCSGKTVPLLLEPVNCTVPSVRKVRFCSRIFSKLGDADPVVFSKFGLKTTSALWSWKQEFEY